MRPAPSAHQHRAAGAGGDLGHRGLGGAVGLDPLPDADQDRARVVSCRLLLAADPAAELLERGEADFQALMDAAEAIEPEAETCAACGARLFGIGPEMSHGGHHRQGEDQGA